MTIPVPDWIEITRFPEDAEDGRHTWRATVVRGCPWDPGARIEHTPLRRLE